MGTEGWDAHGGRESGCIGGSLDGGSIAKEVGLVRSESSFNPCTVAVVVVVFPPAVVVLDLLRSRLITARCARSLSVNFKT